MQRAQLKRLAGCRSRKLALSVLARDKMRSSSFFVSVSGSRALMRSDSSPEVRRTSFSNKLLTRTTHSRRKFPNALSGTFQSSVYIFIARLFERQRSVSASIIQRADPSLAPPSAYFDAFGAIF